MALASEVRIRANIDAFNARVGSRVVGEYVVHYNNVRLHSGIGYIRPGDKLAGRETDIFAERDRRLEERRA